MDEQLDAGASIRARSLTLRLGLDGEEPPTGEVVGDDDVGIPFSGWLELMQAIQQVVSGNASDMAATVAPEPREAGT